RWHALWALDAVDAGKPAREAVLSAARDGDPSVRRQAIRQLGTRRVDQAAPLLIAQLEDVDASIRLQAATALGRIGNPGAVPALVRAMQDADLFARYAAFTALNRIGRRHPGAWKTIARGLASDQSAVREGVTFALRKTYDSAMVDALARMA